jgi:hypothetical protein
MARGQPLGGGAEKTSSEPPHGGKAQTLQNVEVGGLGGASDDVTLRFQVNFVRNPISWIRRSLHARALPCLSIPGTSADGAATSLNPHAPRDHFADQGQSQFHHIQAYVDTLFPMEHYKGIEKALNGRRPRSRHSFTSNPILLSTMIHF